MRVVAEGVETEDVLDALRLAGCDSAQGYLIARPMSAAALPAWLVASSTWV
jgi:EAL domain-containing protein (putative c-di-GMP-specific phosphodiesterase class I)